MEKVSNFSVFIFIKIAKINPYISIHLQVYTILCIFQQYTVTIIIPTQIIEHKINFIVAALNLPYSCPLLLFILSSNSQQYLSYLIYYCSGLQPPLTAVRSTHFSQVTILLYILQSVKFEYSLYTLYLFLNILSSIYMQFKTIP